MQYSTEPWLFFQISDAVKWTIKLIFADQNTHGSTSKREAQVRTASKASSGS
jgi:hypothetical protein